MNVFILKTAVAAFAGLAMLSGASAQNDHAGHANHAIAPVAPLAGDSVYRLPLKLVDQNGVASELGARRGQPMLISMFYTSCQFVCPMLIETMRATDAELSANERARLSKLLVSFDPARDDPAALKATAGKRGIDQPGWTLARADAADVRKLAAALGIQYRQLQDGEFNHSTVLVLLDAQGRIVGRSSKMGTVDPAFVKLVRETLRSGG